MTEALTLAAGGDGEAMGPTMLLFLGMPWEQWVPLSHASAGVDPARLLDIAIAHEASASELGAKAALMLAETPACMAALRGGEVERRYLASLYEAQAAILTAEHRTGCLVQALSVFETLQADGVEGAGDDVARLSVLLESEAA